MIGKSLKWKPLKWWLTSLLALAIAVWLGSSALPALASADDQALFKIGGDLVIPESKTVQDAFSIGGDVTLEPSAKITGDIFAIGGDLQLKENTQVEGDAFVIGGQLIRADSAVVKGSEFTVLEQLRGVFNRFGVLGTLYLFNLVLWLAGFVIAAIAGVLLLLLLPGHVEVIASVLQQRPFTSLLYGIGGLVALSILTVLTAGSALGSILIPLANLTVFLTGLFGGTAICVWLGRRWQRQMPHAHFKHFRLGLMLLLIMSLIPIAGGLLVSFVTLFGFGATLLSRYGSQPIINQPMSMDLLDRPAGGVDSVST